jgi:hypothetical protein
MHKPKDAQKLHNGSCYKRGAHGRIFININGAWKLSAISEAQYRAAPETLSNPPVERNHSEKGEDE